MGEKIHIKDEGMRRALAYHGISVLDDRVDIDALATLDKLDWGFTGIGEDDPDLFHYIVSLEGLQYAKKLKTLGLNGHRFETLEPLAGLKELEELWLYDNCLKDISALQGKDGLRLLDISNNDQLEDISAIEGLPDLEVLRLSSTKVTDITVLETLPSLRIVKLAFLEFERDTPNWVSLLNLMERDVQVSVSEKCRDLLGKDLAERKLKTSSVSDELNKRLTDLELTDLALLWSESKEKAEDRKGNNLLHLLLEKKLSTDVLLSLIEMFVDRGVDVNKRNNELIVATPLTKALKKKLDISVITKLIDSGASIELPDSCPPMRTALQVRKYKAYEATKDLSKSSKEYLALLLKRGVDLTKAGTFAAIMQRGSYSLFEQAIHAGVDVNGRYSKWPHLNLAVHTGRKDLVQKLLEVGADPNILDDNQRTPLFKARSKEMYDILLAAGSNPLARSGSGETLLFSLGKWGIMGEKACLEAEEVAQRLVELGVDINARNFNHTTALYELSNECKGDESTSRNNARLVEKFIELGAQPNILKHGQTPIEKAVSDEVIKVFESHKGVNGKSYIKHLKSLVKDDVTPGTEAWNALMELIDYEKADFGKPMERRISFLLEEKATKTARAMKQLPPLSQAVTTYLSQGAGGQSFGGDTVLHLVAKYGDYRLGVDRADKIKNEIVEALIDEGANVEQPNGQNEPPLYSYLYFVKDYSIDLVKRMATKKVMERPFDERLIVNIAQRRSFRGKRKEDLSKLDEVMDFLLTKGPSLDSIETFNSLCLSGRLDIVKKSIKAGADPLAAREGDGGGLIAAAMGDSVDVVRFLLEEVNVPPEAGYEICGKTAIHEARSIEVLELLIKNLARIDVRTSYQSSLPIIEIANKYDIDSKNMVAMMKKLMSLGQSLKESNECGSCAEEILKRRKEPEIKTFLNLNTTL